MCVYQFHEAHSRELGDILRDGRRYARSHLIPRALSHRYRNRVVVLVLSALKTCKPLPDAPSPSVFANWAEKTLDTRHISRG